jgi:hypothetical protein
MDDVGYQKRRNFKSISIRVHMTGAEVWGRKGPDGNTVAADFLPPPHQKKDHRLIKNDCAPRATIVYCVQSVVNKIKFGVK